jgi:hypothetical protein
MFDDKLLSNEIRRQFSWQAVKKISEDNEQLDHEIIKDTIKNYGGFFAKIIKLNKKKYILVYFNNEKDMMKAIYDSTINEKMGESLQLDELIDKNNSFRPWLKQKCTLQKQKKVVSTSDDKQFYKATDSMSQPRCNSDYVKNVNQLNENLFIYLFIYSIVAVTLQNI